MEKVNRCAWCASIQKRLFDILLVHTDSDNDLYEGHICALCYTDLDKRLSWPRCSKDVHLLTGVSIEEIPDYVQERLALVLLAKPYTYIASAGVRTDSYAVIQTRANP